MEKADERIPELVSLAQKNGIKITAVNLHKPSLEDVFLHFTGKRIREQEGESEGFERMRMMMRR
jgi:ABC-2 type transport system ATP-binding protein